MKGDVIMERTILFIGMCVALLVMVAGRASGEINAWFAPGSVKILRDAKPDPAAKQWDLAAARNETEACQLVLMADGPVSGATMTVSTFHRRAGRGVLKADLYKVAYVPNIVGTTPYPDPLPPLTPLDLEPNRAQPVWISVHVPKDAKPGIYWAWATVGAGRARQRYPLAIRVWDFALPDTPSSATAFGIDTGSIARQHGVDPNSPDLKRLHALYYEMLLDHRVSPYSIPVDPMSDEAAKYLRDPRMTAYMLPYPGDDEELKRLVAHLVKAGVYGKSYFYPIDEPIDRGAYDRLDQIADRLRKLAPGYRWVVPFFRRPDYDGKLTAFDMMTGKVNVWCPNLNYFDSEPKTRPYLAERRALGETVWWYVCCGPGAPYNNFFVQMTAMAHRMIFWQQKRENVQGLLYWSTTWWNPASTQDPWKDMATVKDINPGIRGDGSLLYPGKQAGVDGPVSSIRLEMIRDGLEDFDYLTLADTRLGVQVTQQFIARLARSLTDYEQDPTALEKVRRELGSALEQSFHREKRR